MLSALPLIFALFLHCFCVWSYFGLAMIAKWEIQNKTKNLQSCCEFLLWSPMTFDSKIDNQHISIFWKVYIPLSTTAIWGTLWLKGLWAESIKLETITTFTQLYAVPSSFLSVAFYLISYYQIDQFSYQSWYHDSAYLFICSIVFKK